MQAEKFEQRYLLNPGSATGAYSSITRNPKPSFLLMDIDGPKVSRCSRLHQMLDRQPCKSAGWGRSVVRCAPWLELLPAVVCGSATHMRRISLRLRQRG